MSWGGGVLADDSLIFDTIIASKISLLIFLFLADQSFLSNTAHLGNPIFGPAEFGGSSDLESSLYLYSIAISHHCIIVYESEPDQHSFYQHAKIHYRAQKYELLPPHLCLLPPPTDDTNTTSDMTPTQLVAP